MAKKKELGNTIILGNKDMSVYAYTVLRLFERNDVVVVQFMEYNRHRASELQDLFRPMSIGMKCEEATVEKGKGREKIRSIRRTLEKSGYLKALK